MHYFIHGDNDRTMYSGVMNTSWIFIGQEQGTEILYTIQILAALTRPYNKTDDF